MARELDPDVIEVINGQVVIPVILARLDYPEEPVTVNTATFPIDFNGETYFGVGNFGVVGSTNQTSHLEESSINLQLSGVDSSLVSQNLGGTGFQGRDCKIWIIFLDSEDYSIVGEPTLFFRGKLNNASITWEDKKATITVSVLSRSSSLYNPKLRRYNSADQKRIFPNDTGLDYVEQGVNRQVSWGSANAS